MATGPPRPVLRPTGTYISGKVYPYSRILTLGGDEFKQRAEYREHSTTYFETDPAPLATDRFYIVKALQRSSEGDLHVLRSQITNQYFLKKTLNADCRRYIGLASSVANEVHQLKQLTFEVRHRNIVQFWLDGKTDGRDCLLEEFCDGGDLMSQMIYFWKISGARMPTAFILHTFVQVGSGLAWIHESLHHRRDRLWDVRGDRPHRLIHGDIKPENILLRWSSQSHITKMPDLVIADFGHTDLAGENAVYLGTHGYAPPEVQENSYRRTMFKKPVYIPEEGRFRQAARQPLPITSKADIYCFGLVMYYMLYPDRPLPNTWENPGSAYMPLTFAVPQLLEYVGACLEPAIAQRLPTVLTIAPNLADGNLQAPRCLLSAIDSIRSIRDEMIQLPNYGVPPSTWYRGPQVSFALFSHKGGPLNVDPLLNTQNLSQIQKISIGSEYSQDDDEDKLFDLLCGNGEAGIC